ncbi:MAG TPA: LuxR C-terminal-related transcriptional regulator, partial [Puia sp.]
VCTEWTYKEIADRMYLSPRTIDGYRDALFEKLNVKTRVGLAMYAVRNGIVNLDTIGTLARASGVVPEKPSRVAAREPSGELRMKGKRAVVETVAPHKS